MVPAFIEKHKTPQLSIIEVNGFESGKVATYKTAYPQKAGKMCLPLASFIIRHKALGKTAELLRQSA